jgi:predicted metal-dependent HD superfamily phosphohydrolase
VYRTYAGQIRAEYAFLDESSWREGRAGVLRRLLARPRLYRTERMAPAEAHARRNISAELADLSAG